MTKQIPMDQKKIDEVFNRLRNGGQPQYETDLFDLVIELQAEVARARNVEQYHYVMKAAIGAALAGEL